MEQFYNKITFDDCLNVIKKLPNDSVDLIISDPPYGVDYDGDYDDSENHVFAMIDTWLAEMARVLKPTCHCYLFVPVLELDRWISAVKKCLQFNNIIATQCYVTNSQASIKNNFTFDFQPIIFASKGKSKNFNEVDWIPTSEVWLKDKRNKNPKPFTYQYPSYIYHHICRSNTKPNAQIKRYHPNEKNPDFIENLIKMSSSMGDIVLDPFAGSGATAIAAWHSHRKFITIENNENYYKKTRERLHKIMSQTQLPVV